MKLTKTEKLITILMIECFRSDSLSFQKYDHTPIDVIYWKDGEIFYSWNIYQANGQYNNAEIIKVIKAVRKFKEGL